MSVESIKAIRENIRKGDYIQISRRAHGKTLIHRGVVLKSTLVGARFPRHELWFEDGFNVFMEDWGVDEIYRKVHTVASLDLEQELEQEIARLKDQEIARLKGKVKELAGEAYDANADRHLARTALTKAERDAKTYKSLLDEIKGLLA